MTTQKAISVLLNFCPDGRIYRENNRRKARTLMEKGLRFFSLPHVYTAPLKFMGGGGEHLDVRIHVELRKTRT